MSMKRTDVHTGPEDLAIIKEAARRRGVSEAGITEDHLAVAQSVRARYGALDLDLADAVNVALAAACDTDAVLTLDRRDFRAVRPLSRHEAFRVLPDGPPL
ncbi:hypothetical protein [Streptomyces sp. MA15]|uniref:hypothetical protein n=1 Tax=Streptomyces sp. MA15 TaxID=3055061 RepID=UPI0025B17226|nr:hypothetical protein [Streptomyces sp. MA15]MDN3268166.1 hypothetical protein [Streptomyces sp. MA15]